MPEFRTAAVGGTFDTIHKGHAELIAAAFDAADEVIVGLSSDEFATACGKAPRNTYGTRLAAVCAHIGARFGARRHEVRMLEADYGPAAYEARVDVLVVSEETAHKARQLNEERKAMGIDPVGVIIVPMAMADDGERISGTRIRNGEIDADGHVI